MEGRYVKLPPIHKKGQGERNDNIFRSESTPPYTNASQMAFRQITGTELARYLKKQEEEVDACRKQLLSQQRLISRLVGTLNEQRRENLRLETEDAEREKRLKADEGEVLKELAKTKKELKETEDKLKEKNSELISAAQRIDVLQKENKEKDEVISELQSQLKMLQSTVDEQQTTIDEMTEKLRDYTETKSEIAAIREQLMEVMAFQNASNPKNV